MTDRMKAFGALAAAIILEVIGSLSLKGALENSALYTVVIIGYVGAFTLLAGSIRLGMPLGVAYGIWAAFGVVLTAVMSQVLFDEPLTPLMMVGILVIVAGVLCVEMGSHAARQKAEAE